VDSPERRKHTKQQSGAREPRRFADEHPDEVAPGGADRERAWHFFVRLIPRAIWRLARLKHATKNGQHAMIS